ncbi:MAG: hypothetical protein OMM_04344 [Candidatus Magnetoglobus multicellularis str. Araruama]|uniref:Integral membrane protein n=1 Tax=Candidatus Magnetoglobus multicellularis str. Araruama TaxID=890399 RepID=A0A1V1P219_9BACT|nr:MAG: hypothetical protein OMM_04344 [Candidatus Magnetoglobus multicellularis str. Araruama]
MKRLYYVIAILLSIGALYFTFKNVPFQSIWAYSLSINYFWVIIAIVINCISFLIRAYRWQVIVNEVHLLKFWPAYHFTAIAFMMNNLLPGRVGELARPIMLKQRNNLPITTGLTTVVTERLFDLIFLCLLYLVVVMFVDIDPNYRMEIGEFTLSHELLTSLAIHVFWLFVGIIVCIICINIDLIRSLIKSGLVKIPQHMFFLRPAVKNILLDKCIQPVIKIIDHVASGFSFFKRPAVMLHCFILSVILWFLIAFSNYIMTFGCKNLDIGFIEICAVMVIICFLFHCHLYQVHGDSGRRVESSH